MKILVLSNMGPNKRHPNYGVFVKNFCENLTDEGIDYEWIYIKKPKNKLDKAIKYSVFFLKSFFTATTKKYDYIYVHYISITSIPVLFVKKIKKIKIISNIHGSDIVPENKRQEKSLRYSRLLMSESDKIVVPSEYFKIFIESKYKKEIYKTPIYIYPSGGIDVSIFYPIKDKKIIYEKYSFSDNVKYIGYCGRIEKNKGLQTLLEGYRILLQKDNGIDLIIVGEGNYLEEFKLNAKELSSRIHYFPMLPQNDLNIVYNGMDAFIFPTERKGESLGLVAIEAMACGVPVIGSDFAAPKYYIHDGYNGYKFNLGDPIDLADKTYMLLNDENFISFKLNAYKFSQNYSRKNISDLLRSILK